jgi:hypothetical protein
VTGHKRALFATTAIERVLVNEAGYRIGESHPASELSDADVERMRDLHEEAGWGYRRLSAEFQVPKRTVRDICTYRRRNQYPHIEAGKPRRR